MTESFLRMSRHPAQPRLRVSYEFFPPKSDDMEAQLWNSINRLIAFSPTFVSVTYGAGGSTRERTHHTVKRIAEETPIRPAAHLTCVGATRDEVDEVVRGYWDAGVRHIVALRGDPAGGIGTAYQPHPGGYATTADLVEGIRRIGAFDVTVSAYPEKHPESPSIEADIDVLKAKSRPAQPAPSPSSFSITTTISAIWSACARRHHHSDPAGHRPGAELQAGREFRPQDRRKRSGMARPPVRRAG